MKNLLPLVVVWVLAGARTPGETDNPSAPLQPTNLATINTEKDEDNPHLASDGLRLYYSSNAKGKFDLLVATRPVRSKPWSAGQLVEGFIQTPGDDQSAFVTPEGKYPQYLYYATKKDQLPDANFDIYVSVRQGRQADFTAPTPVNAVCTKDDELHPWLTADGRQLYFSRRTKDGWRVFVATRPGAAGAAGFGEPRAVDLPAGLHHATLTPDGRTMYLQGPLEGQRWGLFRTRRSGAAWAKPEPLTLLNSAAGPTGDRSPSLSRDGVILYFASDRPGGKGGLDLYWILTENLTKE